MRSLPEVSVAALAYLGDSVLESCVRYYLVRDRGLSSSAKLNRTALSFVTATAQAEAMGRILPCLTPEEESYFHRGRNSSPAHIPKSASMAEYRRATGMEVLFGALALAGRMERVHTLFCIGYGLEADFSAMPTAPQGSAARPLTEVEDQTGKEIRDEQSDG